MLKKWVEEHRVKEKMAELIRLGTLIDDPEDMCKFEEHMRNPQVSEEQVAFFRKAIRLYNTHKF